MYCGPGLHSIASLPWKSSCLMEQESWTGAISPSWEIRKQVSHLLWVTEHIDGSMHVDWNLGSSLQFQSSF